MLPDIPGQTEEQILAAIEHVANHLAPKFHVPGFDTSDLLQEARIFALEVLAKKTYDPSRPLANFLFTGVARRLCNLRRKFHRRTDSPCTTCYAGTPCGEDGRWCQAYAAWQRRQERKTKARNPKTLDGPEGDELFRVVGMEADFETAELVQLISSRLPNEWRSDWLKLRAGVSVPKLQRTRVMEAVAVVLEGVGLSLEDLGISLL